MVEFAYRHPYITVLLVLISVGFAAWGMWVFTEVSFAVFGIDGRAIPSVPGTGGTTAAYATLFGITATVGALIAGAIRLWQWRMDRRENKP